MVKKDVKTARREYLSLKAEKGYDNETERLFSGLLLILPPLFFCSTAGTA